MSSCLQKHKQCLKKCAHWPGILEAGLHCLYTGFFVIEAATYGLILEQKFHGVLQILLINFYLVLLCLVFIRWNMDINSTICHLMISILSFILTLFVGKLILLYIDYMERPRPNHKTKIFRKVEADIRWQNATSNAYGSYEAVNASESFPKKVSVSTVMTLDPLIVILDISVYLLISISYIVMLLKISFKLHRHYKNTMHGSSTASSINTIASFYDVGSSDSSIVSVEIGNRRM